MSPQPEPSPQPSRAVPPPQPPPAPRAARPPRPERTSRRSRRSDRTGGPGQPGRGPEERDVPPSSGAAGHPERPEREASAPGPRPRRLRADDRDLVVAVSPFEEPNPRIVTAAERAGSLGLLDLGRDAAAARSAMAEIARRLGAGRPYGVRVPAGCPIGPGELPAAVDTVLLADPASHTADAVAGWAAAAGRPRVWAEITDPAEAAAAEAAGVGALVAKGHEAGGRVGGTTTFVLLQQLLADHALGLPVRACGGIGPHTAAAAVAGGAAGVLVDVQLALTPEGEAGLPAEVAAAVRAMDGSETRVLEGHRVYARPDLTPPQGPVAALLGARDLRTGLLPVGQDGASAARLAARHRTTGGVLRAVRSAVAGHLAAVVRARPLGGGHGPGRPLPVAQGPMTRVSDQAAFAEAVAAGGGVPYLALAVMEGPQVRRLLAETAERLGDRPWGVGMLGFAPAELRAEQLAAVAEVRPPYAIIAGGTPGQAAPLEAAGTRTHLHVPSPGLLERYLADGARRFVFEGLECGGHVGPRASFPLWEEQIELLLACREPAALDVLFAGGIHDARSAAMAAAAAAPLAERGARVGVLMGTAYLFTEEAVAAGAVLPRFQREALECTDTVLLHTAPGHATRCAVTPYADTFEATRQRLAEGGAEPREVWEELERLNLGRLRIASKGLRRGAEGSALEPVGEEQQASEGLFMLGQAATLRSRTTTIATLHTEVTEGATELLRQRAEELAGRESGADGAAVADATGPVRPDPLDVAVVGMACAYPGAPDLAAYWARILDGSDAVTEVPAERWDPALHFDPDPARAGERTPSRWGGFLGPMPFDALAHGIPPASLAGIEPVQLLALEISARALADAGYGKDREFDRSRTSVVFGAEAGTELAGAYGLRALYPGYLGELPPGLDEQLPRLTEDSFPGVLANVIAGRVANRLDLGGANCTVDAACASSLAALDLACRQLRDNDSDMVLCGGADVHNGINDYLLFSSVRALSPGGRCRPFDAAADGIALGEGVGALVLKRLADAERDGDRVYAVIKAVGAASDGRSLGLTAPRPEGQRRALDRAYARAGVSPAEVGLIEAHGTGTVVGDTTELAVLTALFTESGATGGACALGSVKSQIGHTKCAAGLAGLIKAVRAVHSGVRPPTLHLDAPVPAWNAETSPFTFDTGARPWPAPAERRIAGVSAFGFGGTNYHAVLTGYAGAEEPRHGREEWPAELFCFRGDDRRAAGRAMARLAARLEENDAAGRPWALRDLAAEAAAAGGGSGAIRIAVVAADLDELADRLERARAFTPGAGVHVLEEAAEPGQVAFLFPGQGSQRPGMLGELFTTFPLLRGILDEAPDAVVSAMFPPAAFTAEGRTAQRAAVTDTRVAQPALGLAGSAAHLLLGELGVRPDCVAGHSYGELTALWAAGVWDQESLLRLSARRAEAILAAAGAAGTDPGSMAAVSAAPEEVRGIAARSGCVVANHNAPRQCVISGPAAAVAEAVAALREAGLSAVPLPVACAFHSEVVAGAAAALAEELAGTELAEAAVPVWSNTTAGPYPATADAVRDLVARQVAEPVRFVEQVEHMYAAGVRTFVEAGPGRVLSGLVGRILHDRPHTVVPLDVPGEHGLLRLVTALAELAAAGVPVAPEALFRGRTSRLPERAPRRPGWLVDGHLVRTRDGNPVPGGLRPARRVHTPASEGKGAQQMTHPTNGTGPARDSAVVEAHANGAPNPPQGVDVSSLPGNPPTPGGDGHWLPAGTAAEGGRLAHSNGHGTAGPGGAGHWLPRGGPGVGDTTAARAEARVAEPGYGGPVGGAPWLPGGGSVPVAGALGGDQRAPGGGSGAGAGPVGGPMGGYADPRIGRAGPPQPEGAPGLPGSGGPVAGPAVGGGDGRHLRTANGSPGASLEPLPGAAGGVGLRSGRAAEYAAPAPADRREEAVLEYLRGSRELVQAQRDVMIGYLASTATASPWSGPDPAPPGHFAATGSPARAILLPGPGTALGHAVPQGMEAAPDPAADQGFGSPQGPGGSPGTFRSAAPAFFHGGPQPAGRTLPGAAASAWSAAYGESLAGPDAGAGGPGPWPTAPGGAAPDGAAAGAGGFGGAEAGSGAFPGAVSPAHWAGPGADGRGAGAMTPGGAPADPVHGFGASAPWPTAAGGPASGAGLPGAALGSGMPGGGAAGTEVPGDAHLGAGATGGAASGSGGPGGAAAGAGMPGGAAWGAGMPGGAAQGMGMPGGGAMGMGMPGGVAAGAGVSGGGAPGVGMPGEAGRGDRVGGGGAARGGARSVEEVMDVIVEIVHTRTGYPRDMLAPELDLEADLSIDSIKRVEIIGALADRIGLPQDAGGSAESAIEELSRIKTLRGIVEWVAGHTAGPEAPAPAAEAVGGSAAAPPALARLRVESHELPPAPGDPEVLRGLRIGVVGGGGGDGGGDGDGRGVGAAVGGALRARGADVRQLAEAEAGFDAVLDLSALRPGTEPVLPGTFPGLRRALTGGVHRLLLVTVRGESAGAGAHGFARSASLEYPGRMVRAVEVHSKEDPAQIAAQLLAELSCDPAEGSTASVAYTADGLRVTSRPVPAPLLPGDGTPPLDAGSVVLLTGGARGITARTALALARATGCHVELMGRTPQPAAEADQFGHATDRVALRAALIATGLRTPAEIEAAASRILAEREVRATLEALAGVAASVGYHCADVTDEQAVRAVVAAVRARHGRLDGIVHGAGTLSDGLLRDKEPAVFAEVFTTKVTGARHLAAAAAEHGTAPAPRFLALFGSVAGVYGNRGQTDYAAANDALDGLAHLWAEDFPGRVLSVDWGPWAAESGGMVSPELARAYTRRGIPLIDPEAGGAAFLAELAHGTDVQVVLMAADGPEGNERHG